MRIKTVPAPVIPLIAVCSILVGIIIATSFKLPGELKAANFWVEGNRDAQEKVVMPSLKGLFKEVNPAVVSIYTTKTIKQDGMKRHYNQDDGGNPNEDFFERFFGVVPEREMLQRGLGSGFIISNDGYILTNYHVVVDADKIMVAVSENEKEQYQATLIGKDKNTDVALIKIDPKDKVLPVVALGDSDALEIGDWVIAIGSPFGLGHTLTQGIVSAKARIIGAGPYDNFIQTDAAINFGNSGGPMFNMKGQVVGINTAIVASGQNIGFAIPINMVRDMLPDLKSKGEVTRGWLGVSIQEVTPEIAKAVGLKEPKGAMVTDVFPGNPAAMAGVKKGDIILSINGHYADDASELTRFIGGLKPGAKVSIVVWRDRKEVTLSTELMKRDDEKIAGISGEGTPGGKGDAHESKDKLGLSVSSITPDIARRYRIQDTAGVIVTDVDPKGLASASEIRKGDIIREVNGQGIKSVSDYVNIINKAEKGQSLLMLIERAGRSSYLAIEVK